MRRRIEDYGIVGDLQTATLVGRDGAVDWMCLPRFDSPACFAALLGEESHGTWRLGPAGGGDCTRRSYRDGTLVLESEWDVPEGRVRVVDLMPPRGEQADLVRIVEGVRGRVPMRTEIRLRFDYGHVVPWVTEEAGALRAVAGEPADLQIMYGLDGRRRLPEYTVDWLPGFAGSAPVRIGNGAVDQLQLDVWGEVLEALHLAREAGLESDAEAWELQRALLDHLEKHWDDLDNGLWEVRGPRRAFVHSRVMAWAGFDRAVRAVEEHGLPGEQVERWRAVRDRIHADVCARGYDPVRNTFTQFYGSEGLDAALLLIGQVGFLPWDDPRVVGTVEAVQRELSHDGLLLRYRTSADDRVDGLPGEESTFLVCSFWLVDALHGIGRRDEAVALFERLVSLTNDLGLLSEEYDPRTGAHLGNTPQAFSHLGLVNSALRLGRGVTVRDEEADVTPAPTKETA